MQEKVIITCALTGAGPLSKNPNHPVTPKQIAESGLRAADAGASILHVHVRDPATGAMSGQLELYVEAVDRIREKNRDVLLNLTTGLGAAFVPSDRLLPDTAGSGTEIWSIERRIAHVIKLKPEICTLDLVTGNIYDCIAIATEQTLAEMAAQVRAVGVKPEIELFDSGDVVLAKHLIRTGALDGPGMYSFVMGLNFAMPATPETMIYIRNLLPDGAVWQGFGIGRNQFPMALQSCLLGGHVRVGMEDNVYISRGEFTSGNEQLVQKARGLIESLGPSIASPSEARNILGLE
ncbi:NADPH:quinone reductase [Paraburkholderia steynii]|uniref:NADPH:quinone reductase n=1 Tax=Paraburkholderia steynii TaxID=1245441 RepID=A0A4R0XGB8_9BURK|nr:NADPH:quinone reductase [Paraburkholderia steynii]